MIAPADWAATLRLASQRYPILFVQLGHAFTPALETLPEAVDLVVPVASFLNEPDVKGPSVIALTELEKVVGSRKLNLGMLRERVVAHVDQGFRFILVSKLARNSYPDTVGSDLLADAKHVFPPSELLSDGCGIQSLPNWQESNQDEASFLAACLSEIGPETVSFLSELLWEAKLSPNDSLPHLSGVHLEALRSAGLVAVKDEQLGWVVRPEWQHFREGVALASSAYMTANDWLHEAFVDLWLIERHLRNAFREALVDKYGGNWRAACLSHGLQEEVIERARRDGQSAADRVADLRDPLEWLTSTELLDIRTSRSLGDIGLESYVWTRLREDLVPVRNRAAHMRIITERDARTVATWRKVIEKRVSWTPTPAADGDQT